MADRREPSAVPAAAGLVTTDIRLESLRLCEHTDFRLTRVHLPPRGSHAVPAALPRRANGASGHDPAWLCLRPGEWLALSDSAGSSGTATPWVEFAESTGVATLDHTDGHALFRLSGPAAPWLLSKVSSLDFLGHAAMGPHCAQTRLGLIRVIVYARPAEPSGAPEFDLLVDRSLAAYAWDLLADAAPHAVELYQHYGAFGAKGETKVT